MASTAAHADARPNYHEDVIRLFVIATAFWGVVGFLVGVVIAFQLAFPQLNLEALQGYGNFGRLRHGLQRGPARGPG